jgi:CRP/FNR family transcriptional regulator
MAEPLTALDLERAVIFNKLSESDITQAVKGIERVVVKSGETLFHQGNQGDSIFFVARGQLDVCLELPGGGERVVSSLGPNSILGEMSLLLSETRSATVVAASDAELWKVNRETFLASLNWNERWANQFLFHMSQVLARRLAHMNEELVNLVSETSEDEETATRRRQIQMLQRYVSSEP